MARGVPRSRALLRALADRRSPRTTCRKVHVPASASYSSAAYPLPPASCYPLLFPPCEVWPATRSSRDPAKGWSLRTGSGSALAHTFSAAGSEGWPRVAAEAVVGRSCFAGLAVKMGSTAGRAAPMRRLSSEPGVPRVGGVGMIGGAEKGAVGLSGEDGGGSEPSRDAVGGDSSSKTGHGDVAAERSGAGVDEGGGQAAGIGGATESGEESRPAATWRDTVAKMAQTAATKVFFAALATHVTDAARSVQSESITELLEEKFAECWQRHQHRAHAGNAGSVTSACLVAAAHRVAGPWLGNDPEEFRSLLLELLGGKSSGAFAFVHRLSLMMRRDKLAFAGELLDKMKADWGPNFEAERVSSPGLEAVKVTRCCYHDILEEEGIPEYTLLFCALERQWFDHLWLDKQGIQFSVPSTIAGGEGFCYFQVVKEQ